MLRITISHSAEGAEKYFDIALKTSDYYAKDVATWGGRGAELLGLEGDVKRKDFVALANNKWPGADGARLTARMNKTRLERRKGQEDRTPKVRSRDRHGAKARSIQSAIRIRFHVQRA
jgi:TrwC relaxase